MTIRVAAPLARKVAAIVLAAGASARMGRPKALLRLGEASMLGHVLALAEASACSPRVVVEGAHPLRGDPSLARADVALTHNPDWPLGPLSSLQAGLRQALALEPHLDGVLVLPVERPCVRVATVVGLLEGLAAEPGTIWQPRVDAGGRPRSGHPVLWPRTAFSALLALDPNQDSARTLVRSPRWSAARRFFACDDPGVLDNVDGPEEYRALCARLRVSPDI